MTDQDEDEAAPGGRIVDGGTLRRRPGEESRATTSRREHVSPAFSRADETLTPRDRPEDASQERREEERADFADPFARWVDRQLCDLYGAVAEEPLPDRLRALLDSAGDALDGSQQAKAADRRAPVRDGEAPTASTPPHKLVWIHSHGESQTAPVNGRRLPERDEGDDG